MSDPRRILADTKPYLTIPLPLFTYIRSLKLPQATELVFQLHWAKGYMAGNWKSQVPVERVASLLHISAPSVKRSYAKLISLGLIRRTPTGFNLARNCRGVTITEVLIPAEAKAELLSAPNRAMPHSGTGRSASVAQTASEAMQSENEGKVPNEPLKSANGYFNGGTYLDSIKNQVRKQLSERLSGSVLDQVTGEMLWEIHKKMDSGEHPRKTLNTCLKLFRSNRWRTPYDMPEL